MSEQDWTPSSAEPTAPARGPWAPRILVAALAVALLAAGGVVGNAKWQDHQRAVAHKRLLSQQAAFLDAVRRLDDRIGRDIAPTMHVLRALTVPKPGDVFAARDAFANSTTVVALDRDLRDVNRLRPPTGWEHDAVALRRAVKEMRDAVAGMRDDRDSRDFDFLSNDFQSNQGGNLASGQIDWLQDVKGLFAKRHQKAPTVVPNAGGLRVPPTLTSWVFGVDRACIAGNLRREQLGEPGGSVAAHVGRLRELAAGLAKLAADIRHVPVPRSDAAAIRRDVLDRMVLFDSETRMVRGEADAISRGDLATAQRMVDRLRTVIGGLPLLARGFRKYHAVACGGESRRRRAVAT